MSTTLTILKELLQKNPYPLGQPIKPNNIGFLGYYCIRQGDIPLFAFKVELEQNLAQTSEGQRLIKNFGAGGRYFSEKFVTRKITKVECYLDQDIIAQGRVPYELVRLLKTFEGASSETSQVFAGVQVQVSQTESTINTLMDFLDSRRCPKTQIFSDKLIASCAFIDQPSIFDFIDVSYGLALTDALWVCPGIDERDPENNIFKYHWKDYNLYTRTVTQEDQETATSTSSVFNHILSDISKIGLKNESYPANLEKTITPDYVTNGFFKKSWIRGTDGEYRLYKGQFLLHNEVRSGYVQSYCEYYCAQVAKALGFNYVDYDLADYEGEICCTCLPFSDYNQGYLPLAKVIDAEARRLRGTHLLNAIAELGVDLNQFYDFMVFDAMVYNIDRHCGNLGLLMDNYSVTSEREAYQQSEIRHPQLISFIPVFDNNCAIFTLVHENDLNSLEDTLAAVHGIESYYDISFDNMLKLCLQPRHLEPLKNLTNFSFTKHPEYNLPDFWLEGVARFIRHRAQVALGILYDAYPELKA